MKPLKTWSYLSKNRRRPSEYEIVSAGLHFSTDNPECPWELDPDLPMNKWYRQYREGSPLTHECWDDFRDPDEQVYRTYNVIQDGQENYVDGLLEEFDTLDHDEGLNEAWLQVLARLYTPGRYLMHTLQMASAYITQMAPASTISNCATFQAADSLRWLSHIAYRTKQLSIASGKTGFSVNERTYWEKDTAWQGFRELMEKALVTYDWAEAFTVINLVAKPAIDEAYCRQLAQIGRRYDDTLLSLLIDAQLIDSERSRRWTGALVNYALKNENNQHVLDEWVTKWVPLADQAVNAFCEALPDSPFAADEAKKECWAFRASFGLSA